MLRFMKRPRLFAYVLTWIACAFLASSLVLKGLDTPARAGKVIEAWILSFTVSLLSVPMRMLIGIFPEPSSHSLVRLFRRLFLGTLCGPVPMLIIYGLLATTEKPPKFDDLLGLGLGFGVIVGLVDSIAWDARGSPPRES